MDIERLRSVSAAADHVGLKRQAFWRFRKRHGIQLVSGRRVHLDDCEKGIMVERGLIQSILPASNPNPNPKMNPNPKSNR